MEYHNTEAVTINIITKYTIQQQQDVILEDKVNDDKGTSQSLSSYTIHGTTSNTVLLLTYDISFILTVSSTFFLLKFEFASPTKARSLWEIKSASLTLTDIQISSLSFTSGSLISFSSTSGQSPSSISVTLDSCDLTDIISSASDSVLLPQTKASVSLSIKHCMITSCRSQSEAGGVIYFDASKGQKISIENTIIRSSGCMDSSKNTVENSRGGFLYLVLPDSSDELTNDESSPLVKLSSLIFSANKATYGADIYIHCYSFAIMKDQKVFSAEDMSYTNSDSVYGRERKEGGEEDVNTLLSLSNKPLYEVFVGSTGTDNYICGNKSNPCQSLDYSMKRLDPDLTEPAMIYVKKTVNVLLTVSLTNIRMMPTTSIDYSTLLFNSTISSQTSSLSSHFSNANAILFCSDDVLVDKLVFLFGSSFSSSHNSLLSASSFSTLTLSNCTFTFNSDDSLKTLNPSLLISSHASSLKLNFIIINNLSLNNDLLSLTNSPCTINSLTISNVDCGKGRLFNIDPSNKPSMKMKSNNYPSSNKNKNDGTNTYKEQKDENEAEFIPQTIIRSSTFTNCSSSDSELMTFGSAAQFSLVTITNGATITTENSTDDNSDNKSDDVCSWKSGASLSLSNDSFVLIDVTFTNNSMGALSINDCANVSLNHIFFDNNTNYGNTSYPSRRKNVHCIDSTKSTILNLTNIKDTGSDKESASLWIYNEGCEIRGLSSYSSLFFIPSLTSVKEDANFDT